MSRVNEASHSPAQPSDGKAGEQGILSTRSLLILMISAAAALLAGTSAGLTTAMVATDSLGVGTRVAIGLLAGLVAGITAGLTIAIKLNTLVNRS